jgi:uncharacterized protein (TIGR00304 family)
VADISITLVYLGIFIILAGIMLLVLRRGNLKGKTEEAGKEKEAEDESESGRAEGGALIMIGPIPIVLASSSRVAKILLVVGIVVAIVIIAMLVL